MNPYGSSEAPAAPALPAGWIALQDSEQVVLTSADSDCTTSGPSSVDYRKFNTGQGSSAKAGCREFLRH